MSDVVRFAPKPPWLKVRAPGGERYAELKATFRSLDLHTVCEEARCPNIGECWSEGTATVMLLGDTCTRGCRFCAVTTGQPRGAVDVREPEHVARALARMPLQYVVMTMVDRDDLLDGGAEHVARTVRRLKELRPDMLVETLLGDFGGHLDCVDTTIAAGPDVWAHNIDVLRRARGRAGTAGGAAGPMLTKSSIMVGIGETDDEVVQTMRDLRAAGVDVVTVGQYLRPTPKHAPVDRYVTPEQFDAFARQGRGMGFVYVASGPLVRSSYKAAEVFVRSILRPGDAHGADALLKERLAEAQLAAIANGGTMSTSELAARATSSLLPTSSLVRR